MIDPQHLTPTASLNRVRIVDLPGVSLPTGVRGHTAYEFLSASALATQLRLHAAALGLAPAGLADQDGLLRRFDGCLRARDAGVRAAADAVARDFGRRLAYLVLTLGRGDPANREARPEWDDSYWARWAGIARIWLGGGLLGGPAGARVRYWAAACLREAGLPGVRLQCAAHAAHLPLIGAARSMPAGLPAALVFDFGQTAVKRARAVYQDGVLVGLRLLPAVPSLFAGLPTLADEQLTGLLESMVAVLAGTWQAARAAGEMPAPVLVASLASYLRDNQPLAYQGGTYTQLRTLAPDLGALLAREVGRRIGRPVEVRLIHDGTAAARAYAGRPRGAVIMLGTALGVGFPPPAGAFRPVAPRLVVRAG